MGRKKSTTPSPNPMQPWPPDGAAEGGGGAQEGAPPAECQAEPTDGAAAAAGDAPVGVAARAPASASEPSLQGELAQLHALLTALQLKVDKADSTAAHRGRDRSSSWEQDWHSEDELGPYSSVNSEIDEADLTGYVGVDAQSPHWHAQQLSALASMQAPQRYDLHGYKPHDSLLSGRHENGGTLGFTLGYLEPVCLYGHDLAAHLRVLFDDFADEERAISGRRKAKLLGRLARAANTASEVYNLSNKARYIVVEKARAIRPGASEYDKAQAKFVEQALEEKDFAGDDVPSEILDLKSKFAGASHRASMQTLARSAARGGGGGGGGGAAAPAARDRKSDRRDRRSDRHRQPERYDGDRQPQPSDRDRHSGSRSAAARRARSASPTPSRRRATAS